MPLHSWTRFIHREWIEFSHCASAAAALIHDCSRGKPAKLRIDRHGAVLISYQRWFDAIYRENNYYLGDFESMTLAFRLDLGLYYLGVVSQPFKYGARILEIPSFASRYSKLPWQIISFYTMWRRLAAPARCAGFGAERMRDNIAGSPVTNLNNVLVPRILNAIGPGGFWLEIKEGWRTWFRQPRSCRRTAAAPHAKRLPRLSHQPLAVPSESHTA